MTTLTMGPRKGGYIIDEEIYRSRDAVTVDNSGGASALVSGTVLGKVTASGVFKQLAPAASDGTEVAAGVLFEDIDAGATEARVVHVRETSVQGELLVFPTGATTAQIATAKAELTAAGVVVRS